MAHIVSRTGIGKPSPASPLFLDVGGPANFDSYITVLGAATINGLVSVQRSTNIASLETRTPLDTEPQFVVLRDGSISWGPGGATPTDSTLYRENVSSLRTNSTLTIDQNLYVTVDATVTGSAFVLGSATLGDDANVDTVTFLSRINSDFVPATNNAFDLGSLTLGWRDLFIARNTTLGTSSADTTQFNSRISSFFVPSLDDALSLGIITHRWQNLYLSALLRNDGSTILGTTTSDTLTLNASISTSLLPTVDNTVDLGSLTERWRNLFLGSDLQVDGNTVLGDANTDTVTFTARVSSDLEPSTTTLYNLGSATHKWNSLFLGGDLTIDGLASFTGDVVIGDASSDTVTFNSRVDSDFIPALDNTYDLGSTSLRWKTLHVGPASLVVHNDNTDTNKLTIGFTGSEATATTDSATPLRMTTGINLGLLVETTGRVGINVASAPAYDLEVVGSVGASETIYGMKSLGTSLYAESNLVVKGTIEAEASVSELNLGTTSDTHFVNIGTGSGLQTINLGTGPGPTIINIGSTGDTINFQGTANYFQTINSAVLDKSFVLNAGGPNGSTGSAGIFVEEAEAVLLDVTDALWQSGNIVRYVMTDTGSIAVGNTVTITNFSNSVNNGSFNVVAVVTDTHVDVNNPARSSAAQDETGATANSTNPVLPASVQLSSDFAAWELYSTQNPANRISLRNTGGDTTLDSSPTALVITSPGGVVIPFSSGDDLGSLAVRWDVFADTLDVNTLTVNTLLDVLGSTILGDDATDTVTINATTSFIGNIATSLVPDTAVLDVGTSADPWRDLWLSGSADIDGSLDVAVNVTVGTDLIVNGNTTLGNATSDTVNFTARVNSNIVPSSNNAYSLGSPSLAWANVYAGSLAVAGLTTGSVLFAGSSGSISQNNTNFFWDDTLLNLGLGTGAPETRLHIADPLLGVGAKLVNDDVSAGLGLFGDTVSRIQYSGTSLVLSSNSHAQLGTSTAGTANLTLQSSGITLFGGGLGMTLGSVVAANTYTVLDTDTVIRVDTASVSITANCTIALPSAVNRRMLVIKDIGNNCSTINKNIVLDPSAGQSVEFGAVDANYIMDIDGMSLTLHSDGAGRWMII